MCQSLNLVVVLLQIKICRHTPETFVSLRDMGIPINRGLPYKYTICWQNLVHLYTVLRIYPSRTMLCWSNLLLKILPLQPRILEPFQNF